MVGFADLHMTTVLCADDTLQMLLLMLGPSHLSDIGQTGGKKKTSPSAEVPVQQDLLVDVGTGAVDL